MSLLLPSKRGSRDREGHRLVFEDDFDAPGLDLARWRPFYLPHWSSLERTRPRYRIADSVLRLRIDPDQKTWCPDHDGAVRVSNLQTGHWSGPIGSPDGQCRFRRGLLVEESLPEQKLFVPTYGRIDMRARAKLGPGNMAAFWLIGFEDRPDRSGEITVMEVFATGVTDAGVEIGRGIKRINDPHLTDEFVDAPEPIRIGDWHVYSLDWRPDGIDVLLDGHVISHSSQSPDYPMQLMLNFYDLGAPGSHASETDTWFDVDYVRGYERAGA